MKSKRAAEYLRGCQFDGVAGYKLVSSVNAEMAIERAEADARERAEAAYRLACPRFDNSRYLCTHSGGTCEMDCRHVANFLKHYDNQ